MDARAPDHRPARTAPSQPVDLLDRLIRSSVDGIVAFDRECRYTVWNPGMERISGVVAEQVLGRRAFDVFPFLVEIGEDSFFYAALEGRTVVARDRPFVIPNTGKQGFFEGHYSPLLDESGAVIGGLGIIRDITERKQLEEELLHCQKLDSVGRLAGGIAHDFNNLLTVIFGTVSVARSKLTKGSEFEQSLDIIQSASEKAAGLTSQLLAFARRQVVQPRVLDLNELVTEIEKLLQRLLGEDIEFRMRLEPDLWRVMADRGQMEQVLVNLAINAREAMPNGGELHLETKNVTARGSEHVRLVVRDTGIGMSEETRRNAFEPFFTTKEGGRGLGLASCYGIVKQAGGSMSVRSKQGHGAEFIVDLPRTLAPEPGPSPGTAPPPVTGHETILVAEDEPAVRALLVRALSEHGYRVLEAEDGQAALELVHSHAAPIHAVVTDAVMPRMGGLELAERLRAVRPEIKLLLMSGHVGPRTPARPGLPSLQKPFMPIDVVRRVRELLDD